MTVIVLVWLSVVIKVGLAVTVELSPLTGPAVSVMVPEVTDTNPLAENCSVRSPTRPLMDRFVNVAVPLAFVTALDVPPRVPPPEAMAASTFTPLWLTGFPNPSTI